MALERLRDHGILKDEEIYKEQFNMHKNRIADATAQQYRAHIKESAAVNVRQAAQVQMGGQGARTKTRVYFFNIDMMYILKARLWELNAQLKLRINSRNDVGNLFICKNPRC